MLPVGDVVLITQCNKIITLDFTMIFVLFGKKLKIPEFREGHSFES